MFHLGAASETARDKRTPLKKQPILTNIFHECFIPFISCSTPGIDTEQAISFTKPHDELGSLSLLFQPLVSVIQTKPYLQKLKFNMTQEIGHHLYERAVPGAKEVLLVRDRLKK